MKMKRFASLLALLLLSAATPLLTSAQSAGPSADGSYQFALEDGFTRYVEFDARTQADGSASGQMFFSDEAEITFLDVDGTGSPEESHRGFSLNVEFDGLGVESNQAVMSGTVRDSTVRDFIGQRVLLTVVDNEDTPEEPDKLTWGLFVPVVRDWVPSDAELERDPGVGLTWTATDAEREREEGVLMPQDETIDTDTFPIAAFDFADVVRGAGDIRVQP